MMGQERVTVAIDSPWEPGLGPALLWGGTQLPEGALFGSKCCCCCGSSLPRWLLLHSVAQSHCSYPSTWVISCGWLCDPPAL